MGSSYLNVRGKFYSAELSYSKKKQKKMGITRHQFCAEVTDPGFGYRIPYVGGHYFRPQPYGSWSKVTPYLGNKKKGTIWDVILGHTEPSRCTTKRPSPSSLSTLRNSNNPSPFSTFLHKWEPVRLKEKRDIIVPLERQSFPPIQKKVRS